MRRRLLAAVAALVLAIGGALVLMGYARGADARAIAGVQTVPVLVVTQEIPEGTPAAQIAGSVQSELLPAKAAAAGRVQQLADLTGEVTTVALEPGEQLLRSRFAQPQDLRTPGTVAVPAGEQELSILLDPQRAVGGRLKAGDTVGIYLTLKGGGGAGTHMVLHKVLITQVQGAPAQPQQQDAAAPSSSAAAPQASLMITLAVTAKEAEAVVFGMENGSLWLSLEPADADDSGTSVVTGGTIFTGAFQ